MTDIAKAGTNQGNFIYIDTNAKDFETQLKEALQNSLGMAVSMASGKKFEIAGQKEVANELYFDENEDVVGADEEWAYVRLTCASLIKPKDLNKNTTFTLQLNKDSQVVLHIGELRELKVNEIPKDKIIQAQLTQINKEVFDLIEKIQDKDTNVNKKAIFERLEEINVSLNGKYIDCMGLKGNKAAKKSLMTGI